MTKDQKHLCILAFVAVAAYFAYKHMKQPVASTQPATPNPDLASTAAGVP